MPPTRVRMRASPTSMSACSNPSNRETLLVVRPHRAGARSLQPGDRLSSGFSASALHPERRSHDPEERLRRGLGELYAYYRLTGSMWVKFLRDADEIPVLAELGVAPYLGYLEMVREVLAVGWGVRGKRRERLVAALGHALELQSWISLTERQGLDDEQAVNFMVRTVRCATRD